MNTGDSFILSDSSIDEHLWVVISDTNVNPTTLLIVNLTTHRSDNDDSCTLDSADHPFIKHATTVNYREARLVSNDDLDWHLKTHVLEERPRFSEEVVTRIREGAQVSEYISEECRQFLVDQGLMEE